MDLGIDGRVAVVTGAGGGIGRATAHQLAHEGVRLVLTDLDDTSLAQTAEGLDGAVTVVADLQTTEGVHAVAAAAAAAGGASVLVHATGITGAKGDPLEVDDEEWVKAWEIDFRSALWMARALVPGMVDAGWGRVVFITSENATQPYVEEMTYNTAKAALLSFTKGLAQAYAPKGVLVNAVSPAFIETPMTDSMMANRASQEGVSVDEAVTSFLAQERPNLVLGRRGRADEVAAVITMLCSDRASFVVGSNWRVDGGSVGAIDV